ncbi:MAG: CocE/NonD family hydrolase [Actinomycetes bacterium]
MRTVRQRLTAVALACGLAATGLIAGAGPATASPRFVRVDAHGSVEQVYLVGASPGLKATLLDADGARVGRGTVDELGGLVFRDVDPGSGYRVDVAGLKRSKPLTVRGADDTPAQSWYRKHPIPAGGYGYLTTRDGTQLSVNVSLPGPADEGPYPTLLEYSGYDPSNPTASLNLFQLLANAQGYAYVGVNMRGTGCSGGSFNFFEQIQSLDGYDAVETVAAQPWAGRIGLAGISYPGISQLFVAATQPPHLSAITPLSVIDDTYRGTLYPGGIYNDGFAKDWAQQRLDQNRWPDPKGAKWVVQRVEQGDDTCEDNLGLRGQNVDLMQTIDDNPYYSTRGIPGYPEGYDTVAPTTFVDRIEVPTFIVGQWQDEQTGGHWSEMLGRFRSDIPMRAILQNGTHTESLDPAVLARQIEFLDFYVAKRIPKVSEAVRASAPTIWATVTGVPNLTIPEDRFTSFSSYQAALRAYEAEPRVRVLWEVGGKPGTAPGSPIASAESTAPAWPYPSAKARTLFLGADGSLVDRAPRRAESLSYNYEPEARPRKTWDGSGSAIWRADSRFNWIPLDSASSLSWITPALAEPLAVAGPGSVDLKVASTATDTDLEVTLTEVRPDGQETYVQSGWLRASHRALDETTSTQTSPRHTHTRADARKLVPGRPAEVRVALFPAAHVFRAGSRLRISVQAPGGNRPSWTFQTLPNTGATRNTVVVGGPRASRLVLTQVRVPKGLPTALPPCDALRAQPCRAYVPPAPQTPGPAPR